jgi:hypothetical protein
MEASARIAHRDTLTGLSQAEQKSFVAMMQRLVAAHPNHTDTSTDLG